MSDTPKLADECVKLLDSGHAILLYRGGLGSYVIVALSRSVLDTLMPLIDEADEASHLTDDFTPSQSLYRLTEKVTTGRIVDSNEFKDDGAD